MATFAVAVPLLDDARRVILRDGRGHNPRRYDTLTYKLWKASGLYIVTKTGRLVLEVLYVEERSICTVRVYREEKLEFFFSCKTSLDQGKLQIAISKATDALVSRLPNIIDRAAESEDRDLLRGFSRDEEHLFSQVLNPLPPPCDLDSLEEI